ncbi:MAG: hypothetical protein ACAH80_13145 [Alphaproteobacteria bacterium]
MVVAQEQATSANLPSWRIRVDNSLDRAIIEVRSSESGKILRQYPTEAQLRAFARAQELDSARKSAQSADQLSEGSGGNGGSPAPQAEEAPAPAQAQPAPQISSALATSGTPKQSVVV